MKQTTKNILGVAAIVLLSSGVAGLTTYKMLQKNMPADSTSAFNEMFFFVVCFILIFYSFNC